MLPVGNDYASLLSAYAAIALLLRRRKSQNDRSFPSAGPIARPVAVMAVVDMSIRRWCQCERFSLDQIWRARSSYASLTPPI